MTKKLPDHVKLNRRPIKQACDFCHSKHLQCDESRPCKNCLKRGVGDDCKDSERKRGRGTGVKKNNSKLSKSSTDGLELVSNGGIVKPKAKRGRKKNIDLEASIIVPTPAATVKPSPMEVNIANSIQSTEATISPALSVTPTVYENNPVTPGSIHIDNQYQNSSQNSNGRHSQVGTHNHHNNHPNNNNLLNSPPGLEMKTSRTSFIPPAYLYSQQRQQAQAHGQTQIQGHSSNNGNSNNLSPAFSLSRRDATSDILSTASDILSTTSRSSSAKRPFESAMANDEYTQLTDLINTNPPSPSSADFLDFDDANDGFTRKFTGRPFIQINSEKDSMISSYPNNGTPNSFIYNPKHSQMPNTAKVIQNDIQEEENYTPPLIMRHIIKHPDDIYLTLAVKAYQYPMAYHALISYLKSRFDREQLIEIAKCMAKYRPSFISATKSLYENDLIFTERSFQRTLLEYEKLIQGSPSPTLIWRRTGEIVAMTNEFAIMTGYSRIALLSKRTFIVEIMDDESTIRYFQSFSNMAFGDLNATLLTNCVLRKATENDYLRCACVWTIKRDVFDIPMLIVGQFLPILN